MRLCNICKNRFLFSPSIKFNVVDYRECEICKGNIKGFVELFNLKLNGVVDYLKTRGVKRFSISTLVNRKYIIGDEEIFDISPAESLKSFINKYVIDNISKNGFIYDPLDSDIRLLISYPDVLISFEKRPVYVFGIYKKYKPNIAQKKWRKEKFPSIEGFIGDAFLNIIGGDKYYMHASGREDVDAINIGGRPFVFEIHNPNMYYFDDKLRDVEREVVSLSNGAVSVELFGRVKQSFVTLVSDSHFDKSYRAYLSTELSDEEKAKVISTLSSTVISQMTPTRVIRRRANLMRKRKLYAISFGEDVKGQYIDVKTEAGMYVKELISGDNGRTKPSISEIIGRDIKCTFLIVTRMDYDFIMEAFKYARIV